MFFLHTTVLALALATIATGTIQIPPFELNMGIFHLSNWRKEDFNQQNPQYSAFIAVKDPIVEDLTYIHTDSLNFEFSGHFQAKLRIKPSKASTLDDVIETPIQSYITGHTENNRQVIVDEINLSEKPQIPVIYQNDLKEFLEKARTSIENYLKQNLKYAQRRYQGTLDQKKKEMAGKKQPEDLQQESSDVSQEL